MYEPPAYHFEKFTKVANKYFKVDSNLPSGVKGAIVVNSNEANFNATAPNRITDRYNIHAWF